MLSLDDIMGIPVHSGRTPEVISYIDGRIAERQSTRIAFLNAHLSNVCSSDPALASRLNDFIVLNDGVGVDIARWMLHGRRFEENLNGTDFTSAFLENTRHDLRVYLFGARADVVRRAAAAITSRWPRHRIVGFHHGFIEPGHAGRLSDTIRSVRADLVLVATGSPRQESWIAENVPVSCGCAMAVGAWFDFVTDTIPRAPEWMRRLRFEWLFRLWLEPRRLARRYLLGNAMFLARLSKARLAG